MVVLTVALAVVILLLFAAFTGLMTQGKLTLDLGWGRTFHDLGPIEYRIEAPPELVFETISAPYLGRTPKHLRDHLEVIEKGETYALAAHYTEFALYTAETVELVQFEDPDRITFHHLRGPVPHAEEEFRLEGDDGETTLVYSGELGIDFWLFGRLAGRYWVVPTWEEEVRTSLDSTKEIAERRADARARREAQKAER